MSLRSRGQEAAIGITVADEFLAAFTLPGDLSGAFTKVRDFSVTPRIEQTETGYIGENADDLDQQVNGYDLSFTVDELDAQALDFLSLVVFKENVSLPPPLVTVSASYIYRSPVVVPRTEIYLGCIMKPDERGFATRKDYIATSFMVKAKYRQVQLG